MVAENYSTQYFEALSDVRIAIKDIFEARSYFLDKTIEVLEKGKLKKQERDPQVISSHLIRFNEHWQKLHATQNLDLWKSLDHKYTLFQSFALSANEGIPEYVIDIQDQQRFSSGAGEPLGFRAQKFFKRSAFRFNKFLARIGVLGKTKKSEGVQWTHKVALRDLYAYIYGVEMCRTVSGIFTDVFTADVKYLEHVFEFYESFFKESVDTLAATLTEEDAQEFNFNERFEFILGKLNQYKTELAELEQKTQHTIDREFDLHYTLLCSLYVKAGTLELPNTSFKRSVSERTGRRDFAKYLREYERWQNSSKTLLDDWSLSDEVFVVDLNSIIKIEELVSISRNRVEGDILSISADIGTYLEGVRNKVSKCSNEDGLKKELKKNVYQARKRLDNDLVSNLLAAILNQNFSGLVAGVSSSLNTYLEDLSQERAIANVDSYATPLSPDKISRIDPREIVRYSVQPVLLKDIAEFDAIVKRIQAELIRKASSIGQTLKFGLEAGLDQLHSSEHEFEEVLKNTGDAMDRTLNRNAEFIDQVRKLEKTFLEESRLIVSDLIKGTSFLTINQNVIDLRIKLVRAKALERSKLWRRNIRKQIISSFIDARKRLSSALSYLNDKLFQVQKFTGIARPPVAATSRISEFLTNSWNSINELPYFYQKLFSLNALTDATLFNGRKSELNLLEKALDNWHNDLYSNAAIVGERGSGKSSLLNHFLDTRNITNPVKRLTVESITYQTKYLYQFLSEALEVPEIKSKSTFLKYVDGLPTKHIFILNNTEKLFSKRIGGFEAFNEFLEIMSLTNRKILWLMTFDLYAWDYLKATVGVADFIESKVILEDLNDEDLRKAIDSRNQISGYRVVFEPGVEDLQSKSYLRLNEEERQVYLQNRFFNSLRRFCRSNISLGLIVWMIAASEKDEETIVVREIDRPDLTFVSNLSRINVFILHLLMLQGQMSVQDLSPALNMAERAVSMALRSMYEDGILQEIEGGYRINPIIYRFIVQMLKERNLIA